MVHWHHAAAHCRTNLVAQLVLCTIRDSYEVSPPDLITEVGSVRPGGVVHRYTGSVRESRESLPTGEIQPNAKRRLPLRGTAATGKLFRLS
jgi:hypothetical protein